LPIRQRSSTRLRRVVTVGAMSQYPESQGAPMNTPKPPTKHQLALMIWLAVFPTLTVINLALGDWLRTLNAVVRTFVLATIAVPIVIYGVMPQLHRIRGRLLAKPHVEV
jgi:antibiotic biosynthesis monooxygenase (ABM) superfamily enzyme